MEAKKNQPDTQKTQCELDVPLDFQYTSNRDAVGNYPEKRLYGYTYFIQQINSVNRYTSRDKVVESLFERANKLLTLRDETTREHALGILDGIKAFEESNRKTLAGEVRYVAAD